MKPDAIRRFELLFPASVAAWLAASALSWGERQAMVARSPALVGREWLVPLGFAGVLALSLLIWVLVRRRAPAGRVMAAVSGAFSLATLLFTLLGLAGGHSLNVPAAVLSLLASGLNVAAAASLLAPASRPWFGRVAA